MLNQPHSIRRCSRRIDIPVATIHPTTGWTIPRSLYYRSWHVVKSRRVLQYQYKRFKVFDGQEDILSECCRNGNANEEQISMLMFKCLLGCFLLKKEVKTTHIYATILAHVHRIKIMVIHLNTCKLISIYCSHWCRYGSSIDLMVWLSGKKLFTVSDM